MRVRIKTLEEFELWGCFISPNGKMISLRGNTVYGIPPFPSENRGKHYMTSEMIKYCGYEIDLYDGDYPDEKLSKLTGRLIWESWMFEEIKEMNRNGANK